ncbi:putative transcription factor interactor and regulator Znf-B family [Helianthus annuus]|nr:putative transcription factor interactor and regulator Znf-B family [Helianthus annuus]KAJ0479456.1 putative transcription factor interactor and regulator Znf-B family [Helianthus annuus]KAJ0662401.1 putative transcription factor interactor and regulator Znf-B family [Helianthus annuus]KAJ0669928.1 putative transcription factor interactor and regulator Znf-B family [Helianthus annuus]KAJ0856645.1 putative transcription factor interactor and regulator Znf-B family [Helianthus annuus]
MKIQCNVCEAAEAVLLCCADEAALCLLCDNNVHAANKLASKHQRVLIENSNSKLPKCDICQEAAGYFFCLEDRALLCRKCDVSIHTLNSLVSSHQRFLLTGAKVGLEAVDPGASNSSEKITEAERSRSVSSKTVQMPATSQSNKSMLLVQAAGAGDFVPSKMPFSGGSSADGVQQWQFDDFLALTDFNQDYNYLTNGSSKVDSGKLTESDGSPILGAMDVGADCLGQVPDASWAVPEMSSPPTALGLSGSKNRPHHQHRLGYNNTFVPDVCYLPTSNFYGSHQNTNTFKRRRNF